MPPKKSEEELGKVMAALNESPFYRFINMSISKIGEGFSEVQVRVTPQFKNIWGSTHGGVAASLLDTTCGSSLYSSLEEAEGATTIDLRISYLAPVKEGLLVGKGKFVHRTRSLAWSQAEAFDEQGNLVARAQAIHKIIKREWGNK
jgi:uncharacterized protein (TIGR00369 family)